MFQRKWENLYNEQDWNDWFVSKRLDDSEYFELSFDEIKKEFERESRIRYKTTKV